MVVCLENCSGDWSELGIFGTDHRSFNQILYIGTIKMPIGTNSDVTLTPHDGRWC